MQRLPPNLRLVAGCLSFVAGYVDALGFMHLGGYFISFMSGNSTRLAVGIAESLADAALPAGLIALFVAGVVIGTLLSRHASGPHGRNVLLLAALLLACAAGLAAAGFDRLGIFLTPVAMGVVNTIFQRDGEVSVGVTYMTGTLVKIGQRLAQAFDGGERWGWAPYLFLWVGLMVGATCGALTYPRVGLGGLWLPAALLLGLGFLPLVRGASEPAPSKRPAA